jgi:hypothetical protein
MLGAIHALLHKLSYIRTNIEAQGLRDSGLQHRWVCSCSLSWVSSYFTLHSNTNYCTCVKRVYHKTFTTDMFQPLSHSSRIFPPHMTHLIENTRCTFTISSNTPSLFQEIKFYHISVFNKLTFHECLGISLKYNQEDARLSGSIYFYKLLYMIQAVPPPIIRGTKLYIQRQVLSKQYCCLLVSWMRWS